MSVSEFKRHYFGIISLGLRYRSPFHTLLHQFCTHFLYIEGYGKEGKIHRDLVLVYMSEAFVLHVVFHLSEHGLGFYAAFPPVPDPFLGCQPLPGFLLVGVEPVVDFDDAVSLALEAEAPERTAFTPLCPVAGAFGNVSTVGLSPSVPIRFMCCPIGQT